VIVKDVLLVEGLKHNLLSISQLCDHGYKITFEPDQCLMADSETPTHQLEGSVKIMLRLYFIGSFIFYL